MTKQDLENLNKKIDDLSKSQASMNELLIRNDEKLIHIKNQLEQRSKQFADQETRLRILEMGMSKIRGYAAGAGAVAGIAGGVIISFLRKILGG